MSARSRRGDPSKPPEPNVPESRRHEGSETETAWTTDVDAVVLTDADLARAYEMFQPEQPSDPAFSGTRPTNSGSSDSNPLEFFAREPSSADETLRTTNHTRADVQIAVAPPVAGTVKGASSSGLALIAYAASDVALIRSESVVPRLARTPITLEPRRPSTWQRRASLALVVALVVGIGVAGVTIVRRSARLTTSDDVSAPPSRAQSPDLATRELPSTTVLPNGVPMVLPAPVDAPRPEVASVGNPSVLPPLANTEQPSRPTAPSTPAGSPTDLTPSQTVLLPPPPAATIGAPAAVSESSPPVATVPVPSVAMPVLEPEPSPPPPVAPPMLVAPPVTTISPASAAQRGTAPPSSGASPARVTDTEAIQTVLGRYRNAFSVLDAGAARAVWPTVDARALERAFDQLEQQTIEFDACAITVTGARAEASCGGYAEYVPKVGNKSPRSEAREWRFSLRRVNEEWLIEAVASR